MSKKLVAYFSATGITARVGYTKEDLDWMEKSFRSSVEIRNESC